MPPIEVKENNAVVEDRERERDRVSIPSRHCNLKGWGTDYSKAAHKHR
jgi:hypothetical protein